MISPRTTHHRHQSDINENSCCQEDCQTGGSNRDTFAKGLSARNLDDQENVRSNKVAATNQNGNNNKNDNDKAKSSTRIRSDNIGNDQLRAGGSEAPEVASRSAVKRGEEEGEMRSGEPGGHQDHNNHNHNQNQNQNYHHHHHHRNPHLRHRQDCPHAKSTELSGARLHQPGCVHRKSLGPALATALLSPAAGSSSSGGCGNSSSINSGANILNNIDNHRQQQQQQQQHFHTKFDKGKPVNRGQQQLRHLHQSRRNDHQRQLNQSHHHQPIVSNHKQQHQQHQLRYQAHQLQQVRRLGHHSALKGRHSGCGGSSASCSGRFFSQLYFLLHLSAIVSLLLHHKSLVSKEPSGSGSISGSGLGAASSNHYRWATRGMTQFDSEGRGRVSSNAAELPAPHLPEPMTLASGEWPPEEHRGRPGRQLDQSPPPKLAESEPDILVRLMGRWHARWALQYLLCYLLVSSIGVLVALRLSRMCCSPPSSRQQHSTQNSHQAQQLLQPKLGLYYESRLDCAPVLVGAISLGLIQLIAVGLELADRLEWLDWTHFRWPLYLGFLHFGFVSLLMQFILGRVANDSTPNRSEPTTGRGSKYPQGNPSSNRSGIDGLESLALAHLLATHLLLWLMQLNSISLFGPLLAASSGGGQAPEVIGLATTTTSPERPHLISQRQLNPPHSPADHEEYINQRSFEKSQVRPRFESTSDLTPTNTIFVDHPIGFAVNNNNNNIQSGRKTTTSTSITTTPPNLTSTMTSSTTTTTKPTTYPKTVPSTGGSRENDNQRIDFAVKTSTVLSPVAKNNGQFGANQTDSSGIELLDFSPEISMRQKEQQQQQEQIKLLQSHRQQSKHLSQRQPTQQQPQQPQKPTGEVLHLSQVTGDPKLRSSRQPTSSTTTSTTTTTTTNRPTEFSSSTSSPNIRSMASSLAPPRPATSLTTTTTTTTSSTTTTTTPPPRQSSTSSRPPPPGAKLIAKKMTVFRQTAAPLAAVSSLTKKIDLEQLRPRRVDGNRRSPVSRAKQPEVVASDGDSDNEISHDQGDERNTSDVESKLQSTPRPFPSVEELELPLERVIPVGKLRNTRPESRKKEEPKEEPDESEVDLHDPLPPVPSYQDSSGQESNYNSSSNSSSPEGDFSDDDRSLPSSSDVGDENDIEDVGLPTNGEAAPEESRRGGVASAHTPPPVHIPRNSLIEIHPLLPPPRAPAFKDEAFMFDEAASSGTPTLLTNLPPSNLPAMAARRARREQPTSGEKTSDPSQSSPFSFHFLLPVVSQYHMLLVAILFNMWLDSLLAIGTGQRITSARRSSSPIRQRLVTGSYSSDQSSVDWTSSTSQLDEQTGAKYNRKLITSTTAAKTPETTGILRLAGSDSSSSIVSDLMASPLTGSGHSSSDAKSARFLLLSRVGRHAHRQHHQHHNQLLYYHDNNNNNNNNRRLHQDKGSVCCGFLGLLVVSGSLIVILIGVELLALLSQCLTLSISILVCLVGLCLVSALNRRHSTQTNSPTFTHQPLSTPKRSQYLHYLFLLAAYYCGVSIALNLDGGLSPGDLFSPAVVEFIEQHFRQTFQPFQSHQVNNFANNPDHQLPFPARLDTNYRLLFHSLLAGKGLLLVIQVTLQTVLIRASRQPASRKLRQVFTLLMFANLSLWASELCEHERHHIAPNLVGQFGPNQSGDSMMSTTTAGLRLMSLEGFARFASSLVTLSHLFHGLVFMQH